MEIDRESIVEAITTELSSLKSPLDKPGLVAEDIADRLGIGVPEAGEAAREFYDLRDEQDFRYPAGKLKARIRKGRPVRRAVGNVNGVVLHQTAIEFGLSSELVRASNGDRELALARRGLEVACHAMAFRRGFFVATHDLTVHVNHGHAFNAKTLGLEVEGHYSGLLDDPKTAAREDLRYFKGGKPTELDEQTVETARAALRWLVTEGRKLGMPLEFLYAHRQSSPMRRADPGEALWKALAPWAVENLDLRLEPKTVHSTKKGMGRPIPKAWDPSGFGRY